ncbi:hypothetical protein P4O66_000783 [Electrophorus voltai]|uniref:LRRCT domain-containing protein n=1 Tax=Electrophorus voltai TaxID=2609070 RepID=A0AAD8ZDL6_9TELE|nr:hypothetical protein P4O66_000783 [Electrophorus voltai]
MFRRSTDDVSKFMEAVVGFIGKLVDDTIPRITIKKFPNQKPWVDKTIREALNSRTAAYNAGIISRNMEEYKSAAYGVRRVVREAKRRYGRKLESQFQQSGSRSLWQGIWMITDYRSPPSGLMSADQSLANELNTFFARFEATSSSTNASRANANSAYTNNVNGPVLVPPYQLPGKEGSSASLPPQMPKRLQTALQGKELLIEDDAITSRMERHIRQHETKQTRHFQSSDKMLLEISCYPSSIKAFSVFIKSSDQRDFRQRSLPHLCECVVVSVYVCVCIEWQSLSQRRVNAFYSRSNIATAGSLSTQAPVISLGSADEKRLCSDAWEMVIACLVGRELRSSERNCKRGAHPLFARLDPVQSTTHAGIYVCFFVIMYSRIFHIVPACGAEEDQTTPQNVYYLGNIVQELKLLSRDRQEHQVHLAENLTCTLSTSSITKRAQQCLYLLWKLRKAHLPSPILTTFYRGTKESILSSCITTWFGNCTVFDCKTFPRIVRTAEKIIGVSLPSIMDIYTTRCIRKATNTVKDPTHPSHELFTLLQSGRRASRRPPPQRWAGRTGSGRFWRRQQDRGEMEPCGWRIRVEKRWSHVDGGSGCRRDGAVWMEDQRGEEMEPCGWRIRDGAVWRLCTVRVIVTCRSPSNGAGGARDHEENIVKNGADARGASLQSECKQLLEMNARSSSTVGVCVNFNLAHPPSASVTVAGGNQLKQLPYNGLLEHMGKIVELQLEENPWNCSCELIALKAWLESISYTALVGDVVCETPFRLHGRDLDEISKQELCPRRAIAEYEMQAEPVHSSHAFFRTTSASITGPVPASNTLWSSRPTKSSQPSGKLRTKPTSRVSNKPQIFGPAVAFQTKSPVPLDCPHPCTCNLQISDLGLNVNCQERKIECISDLSPKPYNPKKMYLTGNYISSVHGSDFEEATSLDLLHLGNNRIVIIHSGAFGELAHLRRLYLNGNLIERLTDNMFCGLESLQFLYLEYNVIREIAVHTFEQVPKLQLLFLNNNLLKTLPTGVFRGLSLARLNLRNNHLRNLPVTGVLEDLQSLVQIDLFENPWDCACAVLEMKNWLEQLSTGTVVNSVICESPPRLAGEDLCYVHPSHFCPDASHAPASIVSPSEQSFPGSTIAMETALDYDTQYPTIPLSVLILALLLLFLMSVFVAAGLFAVMMKRSRKPEQSASLRTGGSSFNTLYHDRAAQKVRTSAGHVYEYIPPPTDGLGHGTAAGGSRDFDELAATQVSKSHQEGRSTVVGSELSAGTPRPLHGASPLPDHGCVYQLLLARDPQASYRASLSSHPWFSTLPVHSAPTCTKQENTNTTLAGVCAAVSPWETGAVSREKQRSKKLVSTMARE